VNVDEELLKKSFERPVAHPGTVVCRFCKGPLDIEGDFCEQCGAPVAEAAPRGVIPAKPTPAAPSPLLDDDPLSAPTKLAPTTPPPGSPTGSHRAPTTPPAARLDQHAEPIRLTPTRTPTPYPSTPPRPTPPPEEPPSGLVGRLKGLFKKG
jgi:hypothetical protein